jgi:hypothetical protein
MTDGRRTMLLATTIAAAAARAQAQTLPAPPGAGLHDPKSGPAVAATQPYTVASEA